jgi:hypothetical protein
MAEIYLPKALIKRKPGIRSVTITPSYNKRIAREYGKIPILKDETITDLL